MSCHVTEKHKSEGKGPFAQWREKRFRHTSTYANMRCFRLRCRPPLSPSPATQISKHHRSSQRPERRHGGCTRYNRESLPKEKMRIETSLLDFPNAIRPTKAFYKPERIATDRAADFSIFASPGPHSSRFHPHRLMPVWLRHALCRPSSSRSRV